MCIYDLPESDVMAKIPKLTTTLAYDRYMAGQKLVSSVERPWRHPVLRSYLEPAEQELLEAPGLQDVTLMTLDSGAEHLERNLTGAGSAPTCAWATSGSCRRRRSPGAG